MRLSFLIPARAAIPPYERGVLYSHLLSHQQLERGIGYLGSLSRLKRIMSWKLKEKGSGLHVTTVGGSVTAGLHGVGDGLPWPQYLFNLLQDAHPDLQIIGVNAAVPGTISSYMAACVNIHVPNITDLVLIEYTVNDMTHRDFANEYRRAYERLIRKLLAFPNQPAVVLMHSYNWMAPQPGTFYNSIERELYEFSLYYDVPALSLKAAVFHELNKKGSASKDGFFVEKARMEDVEGLAGRSFYFDKIHPDSLTGARMMGELAFHLIDKGVPEGLEAEEGSSSSDEEEGGRGLPAPMIEGNYAATSERCFIGSNFQEVVTAKGFEWLNDSKGRAAKFGYVSTRKGSELQIRINTVASSSSSSSSSTAPYDTLGGEEGEEPSSQVVPPDTHGKVDELVQVQIIHLRSYEGMGTATIRCKSGCACDEGRLIGHQKARNSQLFLHPIFVSQSPDCVLSITADPGPRASSRLKVKVTGVIVSEETGEQKGSAKSVEVVEMVSSVVAKSKDGLFDVAEKKRPHH